MSPKDLAMQHRGAFGAVEVHDGVATKRGDAFHEQTSLLGQTAKEAIVLTALGHAPEAIPGINLLVAPPDMDERMVTLRTRAGRMSLHEYVLQTPEGVREQVAARLLKQLLTALYFMHEHHGVVHGDLKPGNIVVFEDSVEAFEVRVVDLGSSVPWRRTDAPVLCTYHFAAPESFASAVYDLRRADAYSLGMTMLYFLRSYMVPMGIASKPARMRQFYAECSLLRRQDFRLPEDVVGLLEHDPARRSTVAALYYRLSDKIVIADPDARIVRGTLAGWQSALARAAAVRDLRGRCGGNPHAFALAACLADRVANDGGGQPDDDAIAACAIVASGVLSKDSNVPAPARLRGAVLAVLRCIGFDVLTDSAATVLQERHGVAQLDLDRLEDAIVGGRGSVESAVARYQAICILE